MIEIAFIVSVALNVCLSLVVLKISLSGFSSLTQSHERTTTYTESLIDRLMANDYDVYQNRQLIDSIANQPTPLPRDPADDFERVDGPDRGGFGSRLGLVRAEQVMEEDLEADMATRGDA